MKWRTLGDAGIGDNDVATAKGGEQLLHRRFVSHIKAMPGGVGKGRRHLCQWRLTTSRYVDLGACGREIGGHHTAKSATATGDQYLFPGKTHIQRSLSKGPYLL